MNAVCRKDFNAVTEISFAPQTFPYTSESIALQQALQDAFNIPQLFPKVDEEYLEWKGVTWSIDLVLPYSHTFPPLQKSWQTISHEDCHTKWNVHLIVTKFVYFEDWHKRQKTSHELLV